jgi:hypothetical protein
MPTLSLKKIFTAIIGILILIHLKDFLRAVQPAYLWLCESLAEFRYFPRGAQAAIAFYTIILIIVLIFKWLNKNTRKQDN